ncbi:MAG TPA: arylsulfatase [Candidatus Binatia bacterium]|nr:arylsulfatase [Candidatus Binatia bacterium]
MTEDALDRSALPIAEPSYPPITELDARKATPPPRFEVKPPKGAPNVLLILLDNLGFSATKTFGGVINMPTLERLAKNGLIYNNLHTAPLCSPSRVAVLTGRNPHSAEMGAISELATAFPGMTAKRPHSVAPIAEILKHNGYSTAYFGKSHEFAPWELSDVGPFDSWPTQFGFERFYGTLSGEADMFAPPVRSDRTLVELPEDPDYYYQTDLADHAISWIRTQKTLAPDKPFFIYYATPGTHAPSQVPEAWRDRYKNKFDEGWDKQREKTLARQKALGIVPPNTQLTPKLPEMPDWETLTEDQKKVMRRQQEIFAAYAEITDYELGRVVNVIEEMGAIDNTLIIYITGDNGSSANGGPGGRFNTLYSYNQIPETLEDQLKHLDDFGGPHSDMTPPMGWAIADNTPFAYAQGNTAYGGTTNGAVVHWPKIIKAKGEIRSQYCHLIDMVPTILESAGLPEPKTVDGVPQKPIEGVSLVYTFENPRAKSRHTVQYAEFMGNRGIYKDGWYATALHKVAWESQPRSTYDQDKWELYNTEEDFSCAIDLAAKRPEKLKEMQVAFMTEAVKYNVLPLDDRVYERFNPAIAGRPDVLGGRKSLTLYDGMVGMAENGFINVKNTSHSISADVEIPEKGADGVIIAQGGMHSGWSLYVKDNKPRFAYNFLGNVTTIAAAERLPAGRVALVYDFAYDGGKPGSGGTGTLSVNGRQVATERIERTIPFIFGVETADVGVDLYTPVTSDYAKGKNKFTGKIGNVTIALTEKRTASEEEVKQEAEAMVAAGIDQF